MWSDELDNKMRETTEGSHTANEERAWVKMEELLDKHLPQKRRRFIPLLLLSLAIIGTGIFFAIRQHSESNTTAKKININQPITSGKEVQNKKEKQAATIAPFPEEQTRGTNPSEVEVKGLGTTNTVNRPALNTQAATLQKKKTGKGVDSQVSDQPSELTT